MRMSKYLLLLEIVIRSLLPPFYSFSMVEKVCRKKLVKRPEDVDAMWLLSNLYLWYRRFPEARTQLEMMRRVGVDNTSIRLLLARAYFQLDDYERVVTVLQRSDVDPGSTANYYLGYSLMKLERYTEAITCLEDYTRANQKSDYAFASLGYSYMMAGLFEKALGAYTKAARLKPSDEELRISLKLCTEKLEGRRST